MTYDKLEAIRKKLGYDKPSWCAAIGITRQTYYCYRSRGNKPNTATSLLARIYDSGIVTIGDMKRRGIWP
jgi:hypothetical protein